MGESGQSYLKPLSGRIKRKRFLVLDIESKNDDSQRAGFTRPFMVGIYNGIDYYPVYSQNSSAEHHWTEAYWKRGGCVDRAMRAILKHKYRGHNIYAHNAGRFDFLFLLPWLMNEGRKLGYKFSVVPISSSIQVLDVWKGEHRHRTWRFLDSMRLIPTSLNKAAKAFGCGQKVDHDLNIPETDHKSWNIYNREDCVLNYEIMLKFHEYVENVLCGEVGITAPSTAIKLFRRNYLHRSLPRTIESHEFVREGYFGGRVESYIKSGTRLSYYDINSSYPASMLSPMPVGEGVYWQGVPPERYKRDLIGFVRCRVTVPDNLPLPPLPVRGGTATNTPKKLLFPTGRLEGIWEWSELQQAMSMGCTIDHWIDGWWYQGEEIFGSFVHDLYAYRDKTRPDYDEGLSAVAKLLLNSAYGKFAMRTVRKKIYLYDDPECPADATPASPGPECEVFYAEEESDADYIMPQVSARITALSRVRLLRFMLDAQACGGRVYYCDTDSCVTDVEMPTSPRLGDWKLEYAEHAGAIRGTFLGPKLYILEAEGFEEVKAKGFQKRTKEIIEQVYRGETIYNDRLEKVLTLARDGFKRGPRMIRVPRTIRGGNEKRVFHDDGSSSPRRMEMW